MQDMHGSPALHHPDPVGDKSGKAPSKKFRLDFRWRLGLKCFSYCMQKTKGFSRLWLVLEEKRVMETASLRWAPGVLAWQQEQMKKPTAPEGLPRRSPTPVLTGPCAA